MDLGLLLDDKQELITERDGFRNKIRRLNYELSISLNANKEQNILDIDSILLENKYVLEIIFAFINLIKKKKKINCLEFRYLNERLQLEIAEKKMIKKTNSLYQVYVPYRFLRYYF